MDDHPRLSQLHQTTATLAVDRNWSCDVRTGRTTIGTFGIRADDLERWHDKRVERLDNAVTQVGYV